MGFSDCKGTSSTGVGGRGGAMGSAVCQHEWERERERERERENVLFKHTHTAAQTLTETYAQVWVKVVLVGEGEGCTAYQQPQTHHELHSQATYIRTCTATVTIYLSMTRFKQCTNNIILHCQPWHQTAPELLHCQTEWWLPLQMSPWEQWLQIKIFTYHKWVCLSIACICMRKTEWGGGGELGRGREGGRERERKREHLHTYL